MAINPRAPRSVIIEPAELDGDDIISLSFEEALEIIQNEEEKFARIKVMLVQNYSN